LIVRLPLAPEQDSLRPSRSQSNIAIPLPRAEVGLRILVVDDNEDAANALSEALELMGHATCVVRDGPTALEMAEPFAPEIALVDIELPVMDGYELARRLREQRGGAGLLLVAITGYGQERDRERALEAGFNVHLVKPVTLERLRAVLEELVPKEASA
jgi:CheY-like chemotaxis protein